MLLVLKIWIYGKPYSMYYLSEEGFVLSVLQSSSYSSIDIEDKVTRKYKCLVTSALFLQPFIRECLTSEVYRICVLENIKQLFGTTANGTVFMKLKLEPPHREILDYAW